LKASGIDLGKQAKALGFTARFLPYRGKALSEGRHPIILQLLHNGKGKRYSTKEACTLEQWDEDVGRVKARVKGAAANNGVLSAIETKVCEIVGSLVATKALSLENFDNRYSKPKAADDVIAYLEHLEGKLRAEGRISYAIMHRNATSALRRFSNGKTVQFAELTPTKLESLEQYLKGVGCTNGGIATYMRVLRVAVNTAIKQGLLHRDQYPFETVRSRGYSMKRLKSKSNPRSLTEQDMDKVKSFPFAEHPHLKESARLFLFSYYARGINLTDIAQLKRSDICEGRIHYRRQKTDDAFSIPVSDTLAEILATFDGHGGPYLFPILDELHATEKQQWDRIQRSLRKFNKDLKEIAEVVGITVPLTSYVARHTFATTLKRKGVDVSVISELMGHESVNTTRAYLARFGSEVLDATDALL
jgi:site-specific recombinase XerD